MSIMEAPSTIAVWHGDGLDPARIAMTATPEAMRPAHRSTNRPAEVNRVNLRQPFSGS